ncbi:MAG: hypothetical protein ACK5Z5_01635 [Neisseriaceae bacterium]
MLIIKKYILTPLLFLLSKLPISWLRFIGYWIGICGLKFSKKTSKRLINNLLRTGIASELNVDIVAKQSAGELGKTFIETICIAWPRSSQYCDKLIKAWNGFDAVLNQQNLDKPIIFLTPHIGNFEIMVKAVANRFKKDVTILYKPSKDAWFHQLMLSGRTGKGINPVPTNNKGVIALIRALKRKEYIGVLPDSVASQGDGVWVNFFGNKVFATTLSAKMILSDDAAVFVAAAYRVTGGFSLDFIPYIRKSDDVNTIVQDIYDIMERLVIKSPTQYFWSYDRFRVPNHAKYL